MKTIIFDPAVYHRQLSQKIARHTADLAQALHAIRNGTFTEGARSRGPNAIMKIEYPGLDIELEAEQRHLESCFRAVVAAFITFLDQMIAVQLVSRKPLPRQDNLSEAEFLETVMGTLEQTVAKVASDRGLSNPKKIKCFDGISSFAQSSSDGIFALRRCLEHHGGIAESKIIFPYRALRFGSGDEEVSAYPFTAKENTGIVLKAPDKEFVVERGQRPKLGEQELHDLIFTMQMQSAVEILSLFSGPTISKEP